MMISKLMEEFALKHHANLQEYKIQSESLQSPLLIKLNKFLASDSIEKFRTIEITGDFEECPYTIKSTSLLSNSLVHSSILFEMKSYCDIDASLLLVKTEGEKILPLTIIAMMFWFFEQNRFEQVMRAKKFKHSECVNLLGQIHYNNDLFVNQIIRPLQREIKIALSGSFDTLFIEPLAEESKHEYCIRLGLRIPTLAAMEEHFALLKQIGFSMRRFG